MPRPEAGDAAQHGAAGKAVLLVQSEHHVGDKTGIGASTLRQIGAELQAIFDHGRSRGVVMQESLAVGLASSIVRPNAARRKISGQ